MERQRTPSLGLIARPLLSVRQAGELPGITESTAYRCLNAGELPGAVRVGGRWYVRRAVLERWIAGGDAHADLAA